MKKFFIFIIIFLSVFPPVIFPFFSETISLSVQNSISVCIKTLIPSLFPFLFFTKLATHFSGDFLSEILSPIFMPLFKISKNACRTVVLGILGGFPAGASDAALLYSEKKISKEEAERLPLFCNNAGLMFTVGTIGVAYFNSLKVGFVLYCYHLFSSLILALITRPSNVFSYPHKKVQNLPSVKDFPKAFGKAVSGSIKSISLISGNFIIFKLISDILALFFEKGTAFSFITGLFEVTSGILSMPKTKEGLILSAFLLSFNGLCVHMQSMCFQASSGLSFKKLFAGKLFSGFLSAFLMYVSFPESILSQNSFPSMAFYVILLIIPFIFISFAFIKKKKASATG